jgi:hypothetical protein
MPLSREVRPGRVGESVGIPSRLWDDIWMGGDGSRRADADDPRLSDALHLLASLDLPGTCDT